FMLFYAGHIDILRGINTIIDALPLLRDAIPDFKFVLAGRFNRKYYDPIRYADDLGVLDMIEYHEWIPLQKLPSYIAASKVCIFIPPNTPEMNRTIVTKVYQNIVMHKPMIVGQPELMKNLVESNRIGLSIRESDPRDLAEKLKMLRSSPELLKSFEKNASLIAGNYYWEVTSAPLSDQYSKFKERLSSRVHE
ncbi:MAG: glycosyltransferase, partial [Methanosarcina sp.]|nr:glycosyltransferase [Methanosarcina sp.]